MILLDPTTVAVLRSWRATQNEERLLVGAGYQNDGFVFCKPDGTPYHPELFSREFDRKQEQFNRTRAGDPLPQAHAPWPPAHVGHARAPGRHRHQDRQ